METYQNEISELRHANARGKKVMSEKSEELVHCQRKCEQSDKEVRSLRFRIEQLKEELGQTQDDLDTCQDTVRRLERSNDELVSQCEGLQVQVEHQKIRFVFFHVVCFVEFDFFSLF